MKSMIAAGWLMFGTLVFGVPGLWSTIPLPIKLIHMMELKGADEFNQFVNSNKASVVYFFKPGGTDQQWQFFFEEMEKSAGLMMSLGTSFGIVDCTVDRMIGKCDQPDSHKKVNFYSNGRFLADISTRAMFSTDAIVSNVLHFVLLYEVPIIQNSNELKKLIKESKGTSDVIFSYQKALGTLAHRVFMENVYVYKNNFRFGVSNAQKLVMDLPFFIAEEKSGVWLHRCKSVTSPDEPCVVFKYRGMMTKLELAKFFRLLPLPMTHDIGRDGDSDPYREADVDVLYIFYDETTESSAHELAKEFSTRYFGLMGIITSSVDKLDMMQRKEIEGYQLPLMALRRNGQVTLVYPSEGDTSSSFLERELHVMQSTTEDGEDNDEASVESEEEDMEMNLESEMMTQDDVIADVAYNLNKIPIDRTHLPALTDKTFYVETDDRPMLMVLFYLTFDARNQLIVRLFAEAANVLAKDNLFPLASVECHDWTDVCAKVNISIYPTIRIYRAGREPVPYEDHFSVASFVAAAKLHMVDAPVMLKTEDEATLFAAGDLPETVKGVANVTVLGAIQNYNKKYVDAFTMAAKKLQGRYLCGIVQDGAAASSLCKAHGFQSPCIIMFKRHDRLEPVKSVELDDCPERLTAKIKVAALPRLPELTVENFATYFAMKKPFLILFSSIVDSKLFRVMSSFAVDGETDSIVLAWMNISSSVAGQQSPGEKILSHYLNEEHNQEELLLIDHKTTEVHRFEDSEVSHETVFSWLIGVSNGDIMTTLRLSDNEWKPRLPGFDFLKMMDDGLTDPRPDSSDRSLQELNEHGLEIYEDDMEPTDTEPGMNVEMEPMERSPPMDNMQSKLAPEDLSEQSEPGMLAGLYGKTKPGRVHQEL